MFSAAGMQPWYPDHASAAYNAVEEYRYDALGRRIWVRIQRDSLCFLTQSSTGCHSTVTRTLWDGDQIAGEIRSSSPAANPGYGDLESESGVGTEAFTVGIVSYTHGGGIDRPLAATKSGYKTVFPVTDWRGTIDSAVCFTGTGTALRCLETEVRYNGIMGAAGSLRSAGPPSWYGSLIEGMQDGSGKIYQRNRYLDPETGRFTQEDPIGLAGGMNLYGFAGGDPVNFSDPFGLCPQGQQQIRDFCYDPVAMVGAALSAVMGTVETGARMLASGLRSLSTAALGAEAEEGVVYQRTNPKTGEQYIGRSKSEDAFLNRQTAHDSKLGVKHDYEIVARGKNGAPLRAAEESAIRSNGGPGKLANKRYEMNDEAYRAAGGTVSKP